MTPLKLIFSFLSPLINVDFPNVDLMLIFPLFDHFHFNLLCSNRPNGLFPIECQNGWASYSPTAWPWIITGCNRHHNTQNSCPWISRRHTGHWQFYRCHHTSIDYHTRYKRFTTHIQQKKLFRIAGRKYTDWHTIANWDKRTGSRCGEWFCTLKFDDSIWNWKRIVCFVPKMTLIIMGISAYRAKIQYSHYVWMMYPVYLMWSQKSLPAHRRWVYASPMERSTMKIQINGNSLFW